MPELIAPKVLSWASDIEPQAAEQAARSARLPFISGHIALMPDAHWGMGATIGSVIPTEGAIIPAAVGVDIGCGMAATRLDVTASQLPDDLQPLHSVIAQAIPAGVGKGDNDDPDYLPPAPPNSVATRNEKLWAKAINQMGSLGSGNHFVEVCLDELDRVWLVLHSGSRGVGNELAKIHIDKASKLMKRYFIELEDRDLAYLVEGQPEFTAYIDDMLWAQDYARINRERMMARAIAAFRQSTGLAAYPEDMVNCHHNFTQREHHHGRSVWLTRKGAIQARLGDRGIIPGSMGTRSYIVRGTGNPASYCSCSHGAGRRMGRKEATRRLTEESLVEAMRGKAWNQDAHALLDEHPDAYKDIDQVMEDQRDLVTIEHTLHQVLNYKGT